MAEIILFTPKGDVDAVNNLRGFVSMCRDRLTIFGSHLKFDEMAWDVTNSLELKGHGNKRVRIRFSTHATLKKELPLAMGEPFQSFAKAYVRYMQGMRPTKCIHSRLAALRALEEALVEYRGVPDPVRVDAGVLNRAAQL